MNRMEKDKTQGMYNEYHRILGRSTPITFLHGLGDDGTLYNELARVANENRSSTLIIDSPGHGNSDHGLVINDFVKKLDAVLDYRRIDKTHLVGFSQGAAQALHYALHRPGRVEKLVLLAPVFFDKEYLRLQPRLLLPMYQAFKDKIKQPEGERQRGSFDFSHGSTNIHTAFLERVRATGLPSMISALKEMEEMGVPDDLEFLSQILNPIHIIAGKHDQLATRETANYLKNNSHHSARLTWLKTGHVIIKESKEKKLEALLTSLLCH
jgi:pimeloyl-ACP methyl ester carboxylesterase